MADEQLYDDGRARNLEALLRALADRIRTLDANDALLANAGELMRLIGDVRSELFHYEVRCTYDTPEIAEHRRLVDEARQDDAALESSLDRPGERWGEQGWEPTGWTPDDDEETEW
jgi:uncharacterized protein (DUF934 family)